MDFQIIVGPFVSCQSFFKLSKSVKQFYFFPHFAEGFYACLTNCVVVFRETGSVTHKKGAGTEEIVTRNKLRRTFSNL
jgi:hypothetical protein